MADTRIENAIVEAILIITDKRIALAGYDKTIKGVVKDVLDSAAGKYEIKYQDSLLEAYATSSDLSYQTGQMVSVLIPGNDWSRTKTILGGVTNQTLIQNEIPVASNQYNAIGMSATKVTLPIGLSSYKQGGDSKILALNGDVEDSFTNYFEISPEAYDYIKKGDSLALKMIVRTSLASSQVGGRYGVIFRLIFKDGNGLQAIREYIVSNKHVIGQPYALQSYTPVEVLYTDIDTENFIGISSIQAFCEGFPEDPDKDIDDIFISGISINGADALTTDALKGRIVHIADPNGTILTGERPEILLTAQLKFKGKIVTEDVIYYWGIEDGTVFKGSDKYCSWLGDGWRCLNQRDKSYIPFTTPDFYFTTDLPIFDDYDGIRNKALAINKHGNVKCVAVLKGNPFDGYIEIENQKLGEVKIVSSLKDAKDVNKTVYFLDNGHPDLTCVYTPSPTDSILNLIYKWSIFPRDGKGEVVEDIDNEKYNDRENINILRDHSKVKQKWEEVNKGLENIAKSQLDDYKEYANYTDKQNNFKIVLSADFVDLNVYYNFPIKTISGYTKITCTVYDYQFTLDGLKYIYKGTGSITLLNRRQLEGIYSLNIENGLQVFQYDTKGNSPASKQLLKPLLILPLSFTLVDNKGKEVTYLQIKLNGWIKWIIPSTQTMISKVGKMDLPNGATDISVIRADLPLAAGLWLVYENLDSFLFVIDDRYDFKNNINYIWLNVKYKDMILDAYTDFSFPKDGDPGTNGTDKVAKLVTNPTTDRIYISNQAPSEMFADNGATIDQIDFKLYNNSKEIVDQANFWICPPATNTNGSVDYRASKITTYLKSNGSWNKPELKLTNKSVSNITNDQPVNIIRGQYGTEVEGLKYFALQPICILYVDKPSYRLKVKPKTGFSYVVYTLDGTKPDYDNTLPFLIIVLTYIEEDVEIFQKDLLTERTYTWTLIGDYLLFDTDLLNILGIVDKNTLKRCVKPKDNFDGSFLGSAILVEVSGIGFIHIPIYMILNRYGHAALNDWDGNSVLLGKDEDGNPTGVILAPQIGAGQKLKDNTYTGIFMGAMKGLLSSLTQSDASAKGLDTNPYKIGLMGYNHGERTIFLDSQTGKALFGKNNAGRIIFDPSSTVNGNPAALLYSGNYPISDFRNSSKGKFNVVTTGNLSDNRNKANKGMMIDLSTPQIGFGSGNFTVNSKGLLVAKGGGLIAGWNIKDNQLHKNNKVGMASSGKTVPTNINLKIDNNDTTAFWAGGTPEDSAGQTTLTDANFYVTHGGYLFSKRGQIAGWNVVEKRLYKSNVGIVSDTSSKDTNDFRVQPITGYNSSGVASGSTWQAKAFYAGAQSGSRNETPFYVTHSGYLKATSGRIGPWILSETTILNGNVGLGLKPISNTNMNNAFGTTFSTGNNASTPTRIWAKSSSDDKDVNFVVTNQGYLYSKKGKIGGWNIEQDKLWAMNKNNGNGIRINANGTINGPNWSIDEKGNAVFNTVSGRIQTSLKNNNNKTLIVYLFGGDGGVDKDGNPSISAGSGNGGGYFLGSNGTMKVGSPTNYMNFDSDGLTVKGTIYADKGLIGDWVIDRNNKGIYLKGNTNIHIYNTGFKISNGNGTSEMTGALVRAPKYYISGAKDIAGKTGTITFSDGSHIGVNGGLIVEVSPKAGSDEVIWTGD